MRVYRWVILTSLAGLTVILLGTAVFALQSPPSQSITHNELYKQTKREIPLRISGRGAEYLAIVADEPGFMEALHPLLTHRAENGMQVTAVSLAQIVDEFGDGVVSPQAIREFLAYTSENWQPSPQFILLVGDATNQIHLDTAQQNLLPTQLIETEHETFAASDDWFTAFDAADSHMVIGRIPAQTTDQLTAVVNKTIAYETAVYQSPDAAWLNRALLIADDKPYFDMASDHLENNLDRNGYHIHDLHMSQNKDIYTNIVAVLNRGVSLLNYTGHGNETSFSDGAAFTAEDARLLKNEHRLPIFTAFSCQNGAFTDPHEDSVAEQLLFAENGGIVAAIGSSGQVETEDSLFLASTFYRQFLHGDTNILGEVLAKTKTAVAEDEELETAVHTYNLLGDPALHFHQPTAGQLVRQLPVTNPTIYVNGE